MKHNYLSRIPKWFWKSFICAVLHAVSQYALLIFPETLFSVPYHRSKIWILFPLKVTTVIIIFVNITMSQLHYFLLGLNTYRYWTFIAFSLLLKGKWDYNFLSVTENKMNFKIYLYCNSTEAVVQYHIVHGTSEEHFSVISMKSVPKDQGFLISFVVPMLLYCIICS